MGDLAFDHDSNLQGMVSGADNPLEFMHNAMQFSSVCGAVDSGGGGFADEGTDAWVL